MAVKLWTPDDDIRLNATITQTGTFCVSFHTYLKNSSFCAYCAFLLEGCRHYGHNFVGFVKKSVISLVRQVRLVIFFSYRNLSSLTNPERRLRAGQILVSPVRPGLMLWCRSSP